VIGGLHSVADVVQRVEADTVAVLACSEMMGARLRNLAWALETGIRRRVKSVFDRASAGAAVVLLLPALAAIAVVIRMEGPGPVLFRQTRVAGQTSVVLMTATACCSRCVRTRALPAWAPG
jgi:lipopolysaccharide/colanic/teichoic acid biosynthesis glycosyltransferase